MKFQNLRGGRIVLKDVKVVKAKTVFENFDIILSFELRNFTCVGVGFVENLFSLITAY